MKTVRRKSMRRCKATRKRSQRKRKATHKRKTMRINSRSSRHNGGMKTRTQRKREMEEKEQGALAALDETLNDYTDSGSKIPRNKRFFGESLGNDEYNDEWLEAAKNEWTEGAEDREKNKELRNKNRNKQKECRDECFKKNGCDSKLLHLVGKNKKKLIKNYCFSHCYDECNIVDEGVNMKNKMPTDLGEDINLSPIRSASPTRSASSHKNTDERTNLGLPQ